MGPTKPSKFTSRATPRAYHVLDWQLRVLLALSVVIATMAAMAQDAAGIPHVVIIGAGFGGLETAKALAKVPVRVTLVDRWNHHLFQPLLYQVATAGLSPAEIAIPIRSVLREATNARVVMATVTDIDTSSRTIHLDDGASLTYDYLVVAAGARASYFGHDEWQEFAIPLKSVEDAVKIRRTVLLAFERADRIEDPALRRRELTFVVIGGGPTGVELAGSLLELTQRVLAADYRRVSPDEPRVILIEGADRVLNHMSEESSAATLASLQKMGVDVRLGKLAKNIDAQGVHLDDELIEADTIVWAAGVSASPIAKALGAELDRGGRVKVNQDCTVPSCPEVFAIGDIAAFPAEGGGILPGVSPVAMQQGRYVAKSIAERAAGETPPPFVYYDK
ncbi:MAG: FAD-dependent oxidoreductase, partial [Myxococcota bacterium]